MAMRRSIADLVTNFRVAGLDKVRGQFDRMTAAVRGALKKLYDSKAGQALKKGFDAASKAGQAIKTKMDAVGKSVVAVTKKIGEQTKAFAKAAAASAKVGAGKLKAGALAVTAIGAATGIAGLAMAKLATGEIRDQVLETEKLGRSLGLNIKQMSGLAVMGRSVGVEVGEMAGLMQQFKDAAASAASNEGFQEAFAGIRMKGVDAVGQLDQFARKWSRIQTQAKRDAFLSDIFGAQNIAGATELMAKIAKSRNGLASDLRAIERSGAGFSPADLKRAQQHRDSVNRIGEAWRKFQKQLAQSFGPMFTRVNNVVAAVLNAFSPQIVDGMAKTWNRFTRLIFETFVVLTGIQKIGPLKVLSGPIRNTWLFTVRDTLLEVWKYTKIVASAFGDFIKWIVAASPAIQAFGQRVWSIMRDIYAMMNGGSPSAENEFLINWKLNILLAFKAAKEWAAAAMAYIGGIVSAGVKTVGDAWSGLKAIFADVVAGLTTGDVDASTTIFGHIAAQARQAGDYIYSVVSALRDLSMGLDAPIEFEWMNTLRDGIVGIVTAVTDAHAWFMALLEPLRMLLDTFNIDLTTLLLFIGFLKFSGLLKLILGTLGKLGGPIKLLLKGFGSIATAVGSSGAMATSLAAFGAKIMTFIGAAGPWALFGAAAIGIGVLIAKALDESPIDKWFERWTDGIHKVDEALANLKKEGDASLDRYGDKMGGASGSRGPNKGSRPGQTAAAINRAATPIRSQGGLDYITGPASQSTGKTVNLNVTMGGQTINAVAPENQVDAAMRARGRSMTRGM